MRSRWLRRILQTLLIATAVVLAVAGRPAYLWVRAYMNDRPVVEADVPGTADDASRMNRTPVAEVWAIPADPAAAEEQLRAVLQRARAGGLRVSIAGARHTMGGHTIAPGGVVIDMLPFNRLWMDETAGTLHAGAGARWSAIIPFLDARGLSVAVMQSNNDFTVGGSISVNCHGWQTNRPPIASTVASLRVMKADGSIVRCDRTENAELFSLVMGGYGLFGVILEAELRVVPNERYRTETQMVKVTELFQKLRGDIDRSADVGMAYARLCPAHDDATFLREALLTVFRRAPCAAADIPKLQPAELSTLRRTAFRAQLGSDAGKDVRWATERALGEQLSRSFVSRNELVNESADVYIERSVDRTDVLQEYFLPPAGAVAFLECARGAALRHKGDLLNVTVRDVLEDRDTVLRYADRDMFSFVMLFNQGRTADADDDMQALARELIDAALAGGGRYYLPYRLHATPAQFQSAYPQAGAFFAKKLLHDPTRLFSNRFYDTYGPR